MRIIASVQSKRGSSRGLVHYLAHSKIDPDKEPEKGRELFNAFTDQLDVRNANNFLKSNCGKGRPTNDELHHLVLSFRPEDFHDLGSTDEMRRRRLKDVARFAMSQLEKSLNSEKLAWAGAVYLNTANPHLHIAIQKRYFTKDLQAKSLNKIPREALPHFESIAGQKQIVDGIFLESAKTKLEELIVHRSPSQRHAKDHNSPRWNEKTNVKITVKIIQIRFANSLDTSEVLRDHLPSRDSATSNPVARVLQATNLSLHEEAIRSGEVMRQTATVWVRVPVRDPDDKEVLSSLLPSLLKDAREYGIARLLRSPLVRIRNRESELMVQRVGQSEAACKLKASRVFHSFEANFPRNLQLREMNRTETFESIFTSHRRAHDSYLI